MLHKWSVIFKLEFLCIRVTDKPPNAHTTINRQHTAWMNMPYDYQNNWTEIDELYYERGGEEKSINVFE